MNTGIVFRALNSFSYYLTPEQKKKSIWMLLLLITSSILDVLGLATLVPVIMAASRPGSVLRNPVSGWLYHSLGFASEKYFLVFLIVSLFFFFLIKNVFISLVNHQQNKFVARVAVQIVDNQFVKYNNMPFWDFVKIGSSQLMHNTLIIPYNYVFGVARQLFILFSETVVIIIIVIAILIYQPLLFVILAAVLVPSTLITYRLLRSRAQQIGNKIDALKPKSFLLIHEAFSGFVELKLAAKQPQFRTNLEVNQREGQDLEAIGYLYSQLPVRIIEMVAILAVATIFLYSLLFTNDTNNLVVLIGLFAAAAYRLMPSMNRLINALVTMRQTTVAIETLEQFRSYAEASEQVVTQEPLHFTQAIELRNVTFAFPESERVVLNKVSLTIRKGEKIGLIGSSGSGKTTLMNLLLRFYKEQQGQMVVDGVPLTAHNLAAWYKLIGYVKQDTFLMEASIQDNITLNDAHVDEQRLTYALEQASLRDFVDGLPEGVHTWIGERGSRLSGGQRQRIGIARAMYKQTQILLLDEATSALDNETEREVNEAISKLADTDITIIIIAHRLTTLRDCDRIYELKDGEVIAEHEYQALTSRLH